jgi:putative acetyltransferase
MTPAKPLSPGTLFTPPAGLIVRARETGDWREVALLMELPRVRWGTLRMPFTSPEQTRKWLENPPDGQVAVVAILDGKLVGTAAINPARGRRSHSAGIGMMVHDDYGGRGIGSAMLAALIDTADNWLALKRLELTVYVDNEPAIKLYKKFGFVLEGTRRADVFRDGRYVDSYQMARLHGI